MHLFTSLSRSIPWKALLFIATGVAALGVCALYTCSVNPEIQNIRFAYAAKTEFSRKLDEVPEPKIIFAGGSSCAHQIDTTVLNNEFNVRSVNMGHHAGVGIFVNTAIGMAMARPGDSLVLALEPETFADTSITQLGYQLLAATDSDKIRQELAEVQGNFSTEDEVNALRPGLYNLVTLAAKVILRQPLDRFDRRGLSPDGFEKESARKELPGMRVDPEPISPQAEALLKRVAAWGQQHQVRLAYLMPWGLYEKGEEEKARAENYRFLMKIATIMPVLRDDHLGVWDVPGDFSDTELHLTEQGALRRTIFLAPILQQWSVYKGSQP